LEIPTIERAHLVEALNDETNCQRITGRKDRILPIRQLLEVALDQDGAESAETHDLCSCPGGADRRPSNAGDVLVHVSGFQTVRRNEGVDVQAAGLRADDRSDLDMADYSGRNPRKDVLDLVVRQRGTLGSAQDSEYVRSRPPTLRMPDQSEIDVDRPPSPSYTGN
jgi:hypothetical protein